MSHRDGERAKAPRFTILLKDEAASRRLGIDLAQTLRTGDRLALCGDLGAGKSTLARAIIRTLAGDEALEVPSPTYTLAQTYDTRPKTTHFDLYRIEDEEELRELGFDEASETGIVLVEWAERSPAILGECNARIRLDLTADGGRIAAIECDPEIALRIERSLAIRRFLGAAGLENAMRHAFPADASARRYERIERPAAPGLVLMDAPATPPLRTAEGVRSYAEIAHIAQSVLPFVAIAEHLTARGVSVPAIMAADLDAGLVLLEDLGTEGILAPDGTPITERYLESARCLAALHAVPFAPDLDLTSGETYRVPTFDRAAMRAEISLVLDWYVPSRRGRPVSAAERETFFALWDEIFDAIADTETNLLLRDVHSPNILWQSEREGIARVGLLDFQDAMVGPVAYDVASLAQDARVDIAPSLQDAIVAAYLEARPGIDEDAFRHAFAVMAAQRATKILGIFVRLHERDGKAQYRRHIPRLQAYLDRTLGHPALASLRDFYKATGILDGSAGETRPH